MRARATNPTLSYSSLNSTFLVLFLVKRIGVKTGQRGREGGGGGGGTNTFQSTRDISVQIKKLVTYTHLQKKVIFEFEVCRTG